MNKLTKERFLQILKEEFENIFQEDDVTTSTSGSFDGMNYSNLSSSLEDMASKMNPANKQMMDSEITNALKRGRTDIDYNFYHKNKFDFIYFTDALATIIKKGLPEAENAQKALLHVFGPFSKQDNTSGENLGKPVMSDFFRRVNRFAASHIDLKGKDAVYFVNDMNTDNLLDAFYKGFENAIKYFNPEINKSFNSLLSTAVVNAKIDLWRKQNQYQVGGEKFTKQTSSLDEPIGNDGDDSMSLGDTVSNPEMGTERMLEKNSKRKIWNAINSFIKFVLRKSKNENLLKFYELYTEQDLDLDDIAKILETTNGNVRQLKMRAEDMIKPYIEDNTLAKFVYQQTGENIESIPFVSAKGNESNKRFVFPRVSNEKAKKKKDDKMAAENQEFIFANLIQESEVGFIVDFTSCYNPEDYENIDYAEYSKMLVSESIRKAKEIDLIYKKLTNLINEAYDGNYNIDTMDLFEQVKRYVTESHRIIKALYDEMLNIDRIAYEINGDYPQIAGEIAKTIEPLKEDLEKWPGKLSFMLNKIRMKYNPKNAFGV